jgi:thioredoxin reductase (NADPH)
MTETVDCLIVGGGPAGLTAAIYLPRFHLSVKVIDAGHGRAAQIPCMRNLAGFPDGISGTELLARMRTQAIKYGAAILDAKVQELRRIAEEFIARTELGDIRARTILIATGVTNRRPKMDDALHAEALKQGRLRYCPICDGYEVTGQNVAVVGTGARAMREAEFLRSFTANVTLLSADETDRLDAAQRAHLAKIGVRLVAGPAHGFQLENDGLSVATPAGRMSFETIYPALGSVVHSDLAVMAGAAATEDGCLTVDAHQRTSVSGLYAAGDVVIGLDQISHAMGQAGVCATTIRNDLACQKPLLW